MGNQDRTSRSAIANGKQTEVAVLAGGCFWGVEEILRDVAGIIDTEVGYTGGWLENPKYDDTHHSKSGHAEAIRVTFDPAVLSYEDLLEKWFFKLHDPTTLRKFSGKYSHRTITGGIGHYLPQEAPQAFAKAIVDVKGY